MSSGKSKKPKKESTSKSLTDPGKPPSMFQEIIITPEGNVVIPWIRPGATPLIVSVSDQISRARFPITILTGKIYCG